MTKNKQKIYVELFKSIPNKKLFSLYVKQLHQIYFNWVLYISFLSLHDFLGIIGKSIECVIILRLAMVV